MGLFSCSLVLSILSVAIGAAWCSLLLSGLLVGSLWLPVALWASLWLVVLPGARWGCLVLSSPSSLHKEALVCEGTPANQQAIP